MKDENAESYLTINDLADCQVWRPTCLLRWKIEPKSGQHWGIKVLQQMWQGSNGDQEWKDIETVN
jgi:hypothetical protein